MPQGLTLDRTPALRQPVLITAFAGWNDAGEAASAAVRWMVRRLPAQRMGSIDPERYHDFTSTRPTVRGAGAERRLSWPAHEVFYHHDDKRPRDLAFLIAREPELRWRGYCETVIELAGQIGATTLLTLGAFLGDTPHRRPVPVSGFATTPALRARLMAVGAELTNYEGSTGITGVLPYYARRAKLEAVSLWAETPQYLQTTANPKAALALVRSLNALLELDLDLQRLEAAAAFFQRQVDDAVSRDRKATSHLEAMERRGESGSSDDDESALPEAGEIISDLEAFLREEGDSGGSGGQ